LAKLNKWRKDCTCCDCPASSSLTCGSPVLIRFKLSTLEDLPVVALVRFGPLRRFFPAPMMWISGADMIWQVDYRAGPQFRGALTTGAGLRLRRALGTRAGANVFYSTFTSLQRLDSGGNSGRCRFISQSGAQIKCQLHYLILYTATQRANTGTLSTKLKSNYFWSSKIAPLLLPEVVSELAGGYHIRHC
jgi:hypothetical protein